MVALRALLHLSRRKPAS